MKKPTKRQTRLLLIPLIMIAVLLLAILLLDRLPILIEDPVPVIIR